MEVMGEEEIKGDKVWLIDYNNPENNEFLACNQFTVIENNVNKRPDVVLNEKKSHPKPKIIRDAGKCY